MSLRALPAVPALASVLVAAAVCAACTSTSHGHPVANSSDSGTVPITGSTSTGPNVPGSPDPYPSTSPLPTSSISATASGTAWTKSVALTHAKSINAGIDAELKALSKLPTTTTLPMVRAALTAFAAADSTAITALAAGAWPTAQRPLVNQYIAALDAERKGLTKLAAEPTLAKMQANNTLLSSDLSLVATKEAELIQALS